MSEKDVVIPFCTWPRSWSAPTSRASVELYRLRPKTAYEYRVVATCGDAVDGASGGTFSSLSTGVSAFDDGPYAVVTG